MVPRLRLRTMCDIVPHKDSQKSIVASMRVSEQPSCLHGTVNPNMIHVNHELDRQADIRAIIGRHHGVCATIRTPLYSPFHWWNIGVPIIRFETQAGLRILMCAQQNAGICRLQAAGRHACLEALSRATTWWPTLPNGGRKTWDWMSSPPASSSHIH